MARNQEKSQSMMNRYLKGKTDELAGPKRLRPFLASECADLHEADRWHHQIIREIGRKVSEIQNAGLGEHRCAHLMLPGRWQHHHLGVASCSPYKRSLAADYGILTTKSINLYERKAIGSDG
jgi:Isy1-like splicing family